MRQTSPKWKKPQAISGVIARSMRALGLSRKFDGWQVVANWADIVGENIAARTTAVRYDDGTLYVSVPDDVWRQQLSMEIESILKDVHALPYGRAVKQIRLQRGNKGNMD
jgi:predicted nucleic acid-binding Zn ribbon protein